MTEEFELYNRVENIAGKLIMEHRKLFKNVCANVDFYSGFVYSMLGIPEELFTPIRTMLEILNGFTEGRNTDENKKDGQQSV